MQTITISQNQIEQIQNQLNSLTELVKTLLRKVEDIEPEYGSSAWWEWAEKQADEDIKNGNLIELKTKKELQNYLDALKE